MQDYKGKKYKEKLSKLKSKRHTLDNEWQDVSNYFLPRRDFTTTREAGDSRTIELYEEIGLNSTEALASALHSMLTPETTPWFEWRKLGADVQMQKWLYEVSNIMFEEFRSPERALYLNLHEVYLDLVAFGNAVMFIGRRKRYDGKDDLFFRTRPLNNCYFCENDAGMIDTVYFENKMTKQDIMHYFDGDNYSLHKNILKEEDYSKKFTILHVVEPRANHDGVGAKADRKPLRSVYYDCDNEHVIYESGYDYMPYITPRFQKRSSEDYGYSPAMMTLPAVKMLNKIREIMIRGGTKAVDPPIFAAAEGLMGVPNLDPGKVTYFDPDMPKPEPFITNYRPDFFEYIMDKSRQSIERMFYTNWMNMPQQPNMTATEVIQRTQESLRMLSPVLARVHTELTTPLLKSAFKIMISLGKFPEPPEDFDVDLLEIEYVSPMDQSQRISASNNILQGLGFIGQAAQFEPSAVDVLDINAMARDNLLSNYNWPIKYLSTPEQIQQKTEARQAQAQQAEMMQMSEMAKNAAGAIGDLGGNLGA